MSPAVKPLKLILASSSPRRRQLLEEAGYDFQVIVPSLMEPDETFSSLSPAQQAEALAYFKARTVGDRGHGQIVLGADTIVALGSKVMGKAADEHQASRMLHSLSGTRHQVITGLALLGAYEQRLIASDVTYVQMRTLNPVQIEQYIRSGEWVDKAGAYAIQETGDQFIESIDGSFSNVVGLPLELLGRMLEELLAHPDAHKVI